MLCPSCGAEVQPGWRHCFECGSALPYDPASVPTERIRTIPHQADEAAHLPPSPSPAPRRRRRWVRPLLTVIAILVVLGLGTAGTLLYLETRRDLRDTEAVLASTRGNLTSTQEDLETTSAELETTEGDLASMKHERNELRAELRSTKADLRGVRGSLAESQATVQLQTGQIETLKICLDGVAEALDNVVYGFYNAAINALNRVDAECQEAFSLF